MWKKTKKRVIEVHCWDLCEEEKKQAKKKEFLTAFYVSSTKLYCMPSSSLCYMWKKILFHFNFNYYFFSLKKYCNTSDNNNCTHAAVYCCIEKISPCLCFLKLRCLLHNPRFVHYIFFSSTLFLFWNFFVWKTLESCRSHWCYFTLLCYSCEAFFATTCMPNM